MGEGGQPSLSYHPPILHMPLIRFDHTTVRSSKYAGLACWPETCCKKQQGGVNQRQGRQWQHQPTSASRRSTTAQKEIQKKSIEQWYNAWHI